MKKYVFVKNEFKGRGFASGGNPEDDKDYVLRNGDVLEADNEQYLWKDGLCVGRVSSAAFKDAIEEIK